MNPRPSAAAFEIFGKYVGKHGVPVSLYVDRDSIYRCDRQATVDEELLATGSMTQFARAMKQLNVELILANSPQAKGRVERMNGTLQDRLVKEMRLAGICDLASANRFLEDHFLTDLNRRFRVKAKSPADVHGGVGRGVKLDEILCFEQKRKVTNDWCISWRNRIFQLDRRHEAMALAGREIVVREKLDGTIQLVSQSHKLHWKELSQRPVRQAVASPIKNNKPYKPAADHPWNQGTIERLEKSALPAPHGGREEQTNKRVAG